MEKKMKLKQAIIISAWPGCGKSYCFNHYQDQFLMLDSDSSEFSWEKNENGINTKVRNPLFPGNYIQHIKDNLDKVDIIFVSSHEAVRQELARNGINYYLVFPYDTKITKEEFLLRYARRGNNISFIDFITKNWSNFIADMEIDAYPTHIRLGQDYNKIKHSWFIDSKMLNDLVALEIMNQEQIEKVD